MKTIYMLLLSLALVYSVEPRLQIDTSWHSCTGIVANNSVEDNEIFTVVSDSEVLMSRQEMLSLQNASGVTLSETNLQHQPDKLTAYNLTEVGYEVLHVVASTNAGEHSSTNRVSYCKYFYGYNVFQCPEEYRYDPPTNFVTSVHILSDLNQVSVYALYLDAANDELACYDVKHGHPRGSVALPQNCTCNSSSCLVSVSEPKGRVIVKCDNGNSYFYEIYTDNFEVLPPDVKLAATSSYKDVVLLAQRNAGLHQDIAVESNMVTDFQNASALPLEGSLASPSNPVPIKDISIVSVNETSELEVGYILRNNSISYFEVDELGIYPTIKYLSPPPNTTWIGTRGNYGSSVVAEASYSNGTSILVTITACLVQSENQTVDNNTEGSTPSSSTTISQTNSTESFVPCTCVTEEPTPTSNVTNDSVNSTSMSGHFDPTHIYILCAVLAGSLCLCVALFAAFMVMFYRLKRVGKYDIRRDRT